MVTSTPLLMVVQGDAVYQRERRQGIFAVERACFESRPHFEAALKFNQERMITGLAQRGYEYVDEGFQLRGPLPHTHFSEDSRPDPGPDAQPPVNDPSALEAWERAEKARRTERYDMEGRDLVDFQLIATFKRRIPGGFRAI